MSERNSNLYWVYGLKIASEIRLGDLLASTSTSSDVEVRYQVISDALVADLLRDAEVFEKPERRILVTADAMYIHWERVGKFLIRAGKEVLVEPDENVLEEDLEPFLTGPVLAILLHQRGAFVLHASAVVMDGRAVVFLGSKGDGKSTLAAHLQVRGHQLISDDLVPVSFDGDRIVTYPGFPRIKLFEDTIVAVGQRPGDFPLIHRYVEKRSFKYAETFSTNALEISRVYVLSESDHISLEALTPSAAFIELTRNSFLNRFLAATNSQREHFAQCQQMVRSVPVMMLNRPHNFAVMNEVCSLLEDQVREPVAIQSGA